MKRVAQEEEEPQHPYEQVSAAKRARSGAAGGPIDSPPSGIDFCARLLVADNDYDCDYYSESTDYQRDEDRRTPPHPPPPQPPTPTLFVAFATTSNICGKIATLFAS